MKQKWEIGNEVLIKSNDFLDTRVSISIKNPILRS